MSDYPQSTIASAAFIKRNWDNCKLWPRESLLAWLQWFIDNDRFRAVRSGGKVVGAAMYRFVDNEEDIMASDYSDTNGDLCYVVLCVAKTEGAMREVYRMAQEGGMNLRSKACWRRAKHSDRDTICDMVKLNRRFGYG